MDTPLHEKSSIGEIRDRFEADVERFSDLQKGQEAVIDAPIMMDMICNAATAITPNPTRILDIGCGAGNNSIKLLNHVGAVECHLVDLSRSMLNRACDRIAQISDKPVIQYEGDIRSIKLPRAAFDVIIAAAVLHHLRDDEDWENVFTKIYDVTAPGGSIWITDMVSHEDARVHGLMWQKYGEYLHSIGGAEYREKVFSYIDREDSPRSLVYQINLLSKVGYKVDILHKNGPFAAFVGIKGP